MFPDERDDSRCLAKPIWTDEFIRWPSEAKRDFRNMYHGEEKGKPFLVMEYRETAELTRIDFSLVLSSGETFNV